ncbi:hypothetical protein GRS48_01000 [Halorubrum sp. JWXQ-INN 858]|uniref:DUF7261 family protein n=1 Tax=Halorubrum sp. JWXQ-INN 858 TaxID=2690782 RepID=UPI00135B07BB|nr:hypothetical protein [Halorubrum sp. JWXQ-INN 858]MWV63412.1 hypothetical protein [Halorubrum sp. JWXQ-INN 858]
MTDRRLAFVGGRDRGQLVLVAAAAIAMALFPLVLAYLQLGYAGDVAAEPTGPAVGEDLDRALERAVSEGGSAVDGTDPGGNGAAAAAFRSHVDADLGRLETARIEQGTAARIAYAPGVAEEWVTDGRWRSGVAGDFAEPTVHGGVVVQDRAGEPVVLAAAFDVRTTTPDGTVERRVVVRVPG